MIQLVLEGNTLIYGALMGSYNDWKRAVDLFEGMRSVDQRPNIFVCALVAGFQANS